MTFTWGQFHKIYLVHQSVKLASKLFIWNFIQISLGGQWVNSLPTGAHNASVILVNIGPDAGSLPDNIKPLPKPMSTHCR